MLYALDSDFFVWWRRNLKYNLLGTYRLSDKFYNAYPYDKYPEILHKEVRPYICLLIKTDNGFYICVPFRSHINHKEAFLFKKSKRSQKYCSGIDFKKTIIINDVNYIDLSELAVVDNDEYKEMFENSAAIMRKSDRYISTYINHISGVKVLHEREFERRYMYSTLPYFDELLKTVSDNS